MAGFRDGPTGFQKWLMRAPTHVYRARLGFLFGRRFLMVEHLGRTSGNHYSTVLEVAGRHPDRREYVSTAGRGPTSDWYRNLQANGCEAVWIGAKRHRASVRFLDSQEAADVFRAYESKYPRTAAKLMQVMEVSYDGTDEDRVRMMDDIPMVAFRLED